MQIGQLVVERTVAHRQAFAVTVAPPVGERDPRHPLRGRSGLVESLVGLCFSRGDGRLHVVHGMGGSGKTSLVLEVVHRVREHVLVWWVDARHGVGLEAGLRAVARQAGVRHGEMRSEDAADVLWSRLDQMTHRWVMVVDNVDDPALLDGPGRLSAGTGWVRPHSCPGGLVLITAREGTSRLWGANAVLHPMRMLEIADAAQILLDHAGLNVGTAAEAEELAARLGRLPLALRMAGSYLAEVNGMPGAFREPNTPVDFASYRHALDERTGRVDPAQVIAGTWAMSVELLHSRGLPLAGALLDLLASFADAPIPYTLALRPAMVASSVEGFEELDGPTLWRMLQELVDLGLVDLLSSAEDTSVPPNLKLHPLIRDSCQARARPAAAIALLGHAMQLEEVGTPEEPECWQAWQALAPHALDLLRRSEGLAEDVRLAVAGIAELVARYLQARGLFLQACREYEMVLQVRRTVLDSEDPQVLSSRHHLASVLHDLGELTQALAEYEDIWTVSRRVRGEDHPSTLTVQHEIARVLHDQGQLEAARQHLTVVLLSRRQQQGQSHPYTLAARHELARVLHDMGSLDEAQAEYEAVLDMRVQTVGAEHPRALTARHNLACLLKDRGRLDRARNEFERTLSARSRVLGEEHPRTLSTQFKLACVLREQGQAEQAHELLVKTLAASRRVLGHGHPDTVRAQSMLQSWDGA
jgi:tetratricopeptide (TPR) repeat protein